MLSAVLGRPTRSRRHSITTCLSAKQSNRSHGKKEPRKNHSRGCCTQANSNATIAAECHMSVLGSHGRGMGGEEPTFGRIATIVAAVENSGKNIVDTGQHCLDAEKRSDACAEFLGARDAKTNSSKLLSTPPYLSCQCSFVVFE